MAASDVVVVGGGVIGLSIAYVLANEGVLVTVIDAGPLGRAASWAGAGMIPPFTSRRSHGPMIDLRSWSAVLYREWSPRLREETGIDNGFRVTGGVDVAMNEADEQDLRTAAGRWRVEGIVAETIGAGDFGRIEPALNPAIRSGYFLPERAQIRNPRHLKALAASLSKRGIRFRPGEPVRGFTRSGGRITGIETELAKMDCAEVVMAAGAWSGGLLAGLGVELPTPPLKGQIVLMRADRDGPSRIVEHGKKYLVPRDDGRILIGASEDDSGFDNRPTEVAFRELIDEAIALCPSLANAVFEQTWTGLRPGSADTRPSIGRPPGETNLIVATGHKRAGLQLAPATAEVVADLVLGRSPRIDLAIFAPGRSPGPRDDPAFRS